MVRELRRVQMGEIVAIALAFVGFCWALGLLTGCQTQDAKSAAYSGELDACTLTSKTLCESIQCENKVRARYQRPDRLVPAKCLVAPLVDGGVQ